jgi:radical SAM superfamily enzyme YgiQ (UPF0313 family)
MELPFRTKGDELLRPGAMLAMRERLRAHAKVHDLVSVLAYAFDHRTRMLPFVLVDRRMSPAGVRGLGAALLDAGFEKTRIVLQTWNRRFKPSRARLDGRIPDLFLVSSMGLHSGRMKEMLGDVCTLDPAERPLVIAGGPHIWYSPWDAFSADPAAPAGADVAVTGEVYVLMELLDRLLTARRPAERLRATFLRAKEAGGLDDVPGLVYPVGYEGAPPTELVDTGIQRLLGNLDELPHPVIGYRLLERPGRKATLAEAPLAAKDVKRFSPVASIEMTYGCKFRCPYCPIPAYNQHQDRAKSPARIADEMKRLHEEYGIRFFFGADDNFFNRKERAVAIIETLAATKFADGTPLGKRCGWGTEATVHDTLQMRDHLRRARDGGLQALWMGVEDMTATLVKKGQSVDKTGEAFRLLQRSGIHPMPMLMHDDSQPLVSWKGARGLLNQVQLLRNAGAMTVQVLMLSPAPGSRLHEETYGGLAYESVNGRPVEQYMIDGNHVVASRAPRPWVKQLNILFAYLFFYNPLRFLKALVFPKNRRGHLADAGLQLVGMAGWLRNVWHTPGWLYHLMRGRIVRYAAPPTSPIPLRAAAGGRGAHALDNQRLAVVASPEPAIG